MKKKTISYIGIGLLIITIIGTSIYFYQLDNKECSDFPLDERDKCCADKNIDTPTIQCEGGWKFDNETNSCSFVCQIEQPRFCTHDVKECSDGSFVSRDVENNCEFRPCPN